MNIQTLRETYGCQNRFSYGDLLSCDEWRAKRLAILNKFRRRCQRCGINPEGKLWHSAGIFFDYEATDILPSKGVFSTVFGLPYWASYDNNWLEVHHRYYILDVNMCWRLPWDYEDSVFQCLCSWCHEDIHKLINSHSVYVETSSGELMKIDGLTPCRKCNGKGWLPEYLYHQAGICFECNGDKFVELAK